MITTDDVLTTCGEHPGRMDWVSPAVERNAAETARRVNILLGLFGQSRPLSSGFRDLDTNRNEGGADYSRHMYGMAADLVDKDGALKRWVKNHPEALVTADLWCEPFSLTPTWLHVQSVPVPSGARIAP